MDKTNLKDVQDSLDTNCTIRTDERKSKLFCKDSPGFDLVKQSKENTLNLLNIKIKQKQKKDIEQGKI